MTQKLAILYWLIFGNGLAYRSEFWWGVADYLKGIAGNDAIQSATPERLT